MHGLPVRRSSRRMTGNMADKVASLAAAALIADTSAA